MGLTVVPALVRHPMHVRRGRRVRMLVDSGAVYSVLPERIWKALGLTPKRTVEFELADGSAIERQVGQAEFALYGRDAVSPVVLGGAQDAALVGAVTLESLGLMLNPLTRDLVPMRMILARMADGLEITRATFELGALVLAGADSALHFLPVEHASTVS